MKKWILGTLVLAVILVLGLNFVKADNTISNYDEDNYPYYGMMGGRYNNHCYDNDYDNYDYEWLYLHLNEENQILMDKMFADALLDYDLNQMTDEEKLEMIDAIKSRLSDYIIDNNLIDIW